MPGTLPGIDPLQQVSATIEAFGGRYVVRGVPLKYWTAMGHPSAW